MQLSRNSHIDWLVYAVPARLRFASSRCGLTPYAACRNQPYRLARLRRASSITLRFFSLRADALCSLQEPAICKQACMADPSICARLTAFHSINLRICRRYVLVRLLAAWTGVSSRFRGFPRWSGRRCILVIRIPSRMHRQISRRGGQSR